MPPPVKLLACDLGHCTITHCQRKPSADGFRKVQGDNFSMGCQQGEQSTTSNDSHELIESERRPPNTSPKFKDDLSSFANESKGPSYWPLRFFTNVGGEPKLVSAQVLSKRETPALVAIHNMADPASKVELYFAFDLRKFYNLEGFESPLVRVESKPALEYSGTSYSEQTLQNIDRLIDWNVKKHKPAPVAESNKDIVTRFLSNSPELPYGVPTEPVLLTAMIASNTGNDPLTESKPSTFPPSRWSSNQEGSSQAVSDSQDPGGEPSGKRPKSQASDGLASKRSSNKEPTDNSQDESQKTHDVSYIAPWVSKSDFSTPTISEGIHASAGQTTGKRFITSLGNQTTIKASSSHYSQPEGTGWMTPSSDPQRLRNPPAPAPPLKKPSLRKKLSNRIKKLIGRPVSPSETNPASRPQSRTENFKQRFRGFFK
ncbi:hypothetical protein BJ875DRAFT_445775 [Amylocarpus encephaloides]|uniref:Uncharacterized protein n=1 Tax=Amylocarpus encephaloides TaxID=45428 RepID=A0A9P8C1Y9_9HELO|nr:hypothetical protein BJ875DRAFT_445775 [Amylocarpus encephaloides]